MPHILRFPIITILSVFYASLFAQTETTFPTNGPDDYREHIHAFTNATIYKDYKTKIENATLVIKDGKVVDAGTNVTIPQGAIVHDMKGKFIYPSFIDIYSGYGLPDVKKAQRNDGPQMESNIKGAYGWNQAIHADYNAIKDFTADDKKADEWRKLGFGVVNTLMKDGIARGTGAVIMLGTEKENNLIIKAEASTGYSFDKGSSTQNYPQSLMGAIALLRQTYYDAQWYKNTKDKKEYNLSLEAWNANQSRPQIFDAGDWDNILRAQKVANEFGVQYIIKGNGKEYQRIDEIKNTKARIITSLNFPKAYDVEDPYKAIWIPLEEMKHWELAPANAAALANAGIDFAITPADLEKKEDFLPNLRKAVKYGLDSTIALKAVTLSPAEFLNVSDKTGSLEAGKLANFIITSKPLFDEKCDINENWILGKRYEIKAFTQKDIRGEYKLTLSNDSTYKLKVTGDEASPKANIIISDSLKPEVKLSYKDNEISFSFNPEKKKDSNKFLLSGTIDFNAKAWAGKGQLPTGEWINWNATQTKGPDADTSKPKKDSTAIDLNKLGKVFYPFTGYGNEELPEFENVIIKNGVVWTNELEGNLANTDVIIKNGKIAAVGKNLSCKDCNTIDATGKFVTSGIIDEHSHIAISRGVNEGAEASSAEVRIGDVIDNSDVNIYRQLSGGVTAAQLLHGSANPIGGQSGIIKLRWGYTPEKMKIDGADGFIKFALGENVKQSNWGDKWTVRYPQTRMGVEQTYYNYFTKAREYEKAWNKYNALKGKGTTPRKDIELDALVEILNSKRFITCHSYVQSEINMLMHVADTFGFKINTFTHILEGYKVADKLKAHGAYASTFADWWAYKYEVIDAIPYNTTILTKMNITTAVNSDDPEMARRLNQEAAKAIKYGNLTEGQAWEMCTLNPAKMLHLDSHMGSIKVGKDADIVVWTDNPLSIYASVEQTFVDGIRFYDIAQDAQKRDEIRKERARLVQKMLDDKKAGAPVQMPTQKKKKEYTCDDLEIQ